MRVRPALLALIVLAPLTAAGAASLRDSTPATGEQARCPATGRYTAGPARVHRGQPLVPRKLTELPPATTYMAVYRHIGPCEAPLTMVEYRSERRR